MGHGVVVLHRTSTSGTLEHFSLLMNLFLDLSMRAGSCHDNKWVGIVFLNPLRPLALVDVDMLLRHFLCCRFNRSLSIAVGLYHCLMWHSALSTFNY